MTDKLCEICCQMGANRYVAEPRTGRQKWFHNTNACSAEAFIEVGRDAIAFGAERLQVAATLLGMRVEDAAHRAAMGIPAPEAMGE